MRDRLIALRHRQCLRSLAVAALLDFVKVGAFENSSEGLSTLNSKHVFKNILPPTARIQLRKYLLAVQKECPSVPRELQNRGRKGAFFHRPIRKGISYPSTNSAPQWNPAPNAAKQIRSPVLGPGDFHHSDAAINIEADDVFP